MAWLALLVGLVVGSFLNVVIVRTSQGQPLTGRSQCPHCQKKLVWYELIPLLSFVLQHGRCRGCTGQIAWRYPAIELLTGLAFAAVVTVFGLTLHAVFLLVVSILAVLITGFDIKDKEVANGWVWAFGAVVIVGLAVFWRDTIEVRLIAGLVLAAFFSLLYMFSRGKWIGGADVKMAPFLGLWTGWPGVAVLFMLAYAAGAAVGIVLLATGKASGRTEVPFLPFLLVAGFVSVLWGGRIAGWYLSFFT